MWGRNPETLNIYPKNRAIIHGYHLNKYAWNHGSKVITPKQMALEHMTNGSLVKQIYCFGCFTHDIT